MTFHPVGSVGFDTNQNCTDAAAALKAYGFGFGVRYVCQENTLTNRKIIRPAEYRALQAAGIDVWLVSEWYTPSDSPSGTPSPFRYGRDLASLQRAADEDCDVAFRLAADCGHTGLLLHAVDWDATGNKTAADMVPYLDRCLWRQMQTPHPFGIYCGGRMLRYLIDVHGWSPDRVVWWQASAWSSKFPEPEAHMLQTQQFPVGGVTVDLNTVYRPLGQGTAIVQPPITTPVEDTDMAELWDLDGTLFLIRGDKAQWLAGRTADEVAIAQMMQGMYGAPRQPDQRALRTVYLDGEVPSYPQGWGRFKATADMFRQPDKQLPPPVLTPTHWVGSLNMPSVPGSASFELRAG